MARYNRINLDGKSVTETYPAAAATPVGTVLVESSGAFTAASAGDTGRLFAAHPAAHQGLGTDTSVPQGDSLVGEYLEEGREVALLLAKNNTVAKGSPVSVTTNGAIKLNADGKDIIGYAQEALVIGNGASDVAQLVRVRIRNVSSNGLGV